MVHVRAHCVQTSALACPGRGGYRHSVVVISDDVVEIDLEGAAAQFSSLRECCEYGVPPAMNAGELIATKQVPYNVLGEPLSGFEDPVRVYEVRWRE